MATVSPAQVRQARADGYRAGHALAPALPNPYGAATPPVWKGPRTAAERAAQERRAHPARILARAWLGGWRAGLDAHAAERAAGDTSA